jgi:hypothetical protein
MTNVMAARNFSWINGLDSGSLANCEIACIRCNHLMLLRITPHEFSLGFKKR